MMHRSLSHRWCYALLSLTATLFLFTSSSSPTSAQQVLKTVPAPYYFEQSLPALRNGDFDDALKLLNTDLRTSVKFAGQTRWIDSICFFAQIGECHYRLGELDRAFDSYTEAVKLYLVYSDWLKQLNHAGKIQMLPRPAVPWGTSRRSEPIGNFQHNSFRILQTGLGTMPAPGGGTMIRQEAVMTTIHAAEIVRSLAFSIQRRAELLGPLSKYDPLNLELVKVLGGRPCPPNHFTGSWIDVLYGLALAATGEDAEATTSLKAGLIMEGRYEHQLTPIALYELGKIALRAQKDQEALDTFFEASISAWINEDGILLADCFRKIADTYRLTDPGKPCPVTQTALPAMAALPAKNRSHLVFACVALEAAEELLTAGKAKEATTLLANLGKTMERSSLIRSWYGARYLYLSAWGQYLQASAGNKSSLLTEGNKRFNNAMAFMGRSSLRLNQLAALETKFRTGQITTRSTLTVRGANEIYEQLLTEPDGRSWILDPMECMAMSMFTPPMAYEWWFNIARERGDKEKAFEIAELARRCRFYSSLPLGPRIFSLRLLFEGDPSTIPPAVLLERQSLSIDFAQFSELSDRVKQIKKRLLAIPAVPKTQELAAEQKTLLTELDEVSMLQEAMLCPIALSRTKSPHIFPPVLKLEELRERMPEKTSMLAFFDAMGELYGFLLDKQSLDIWTVSDSDPRAPTLRKLVAEYLESIGCREGDPNRAMTWKDLNDPKWKTTGNRLIQRLLGQERRANFSELVIVPTGILWYVPFEALCVRSGNDLRPLISASRDPITLRYAPLASLAVPTGKGRPLSVETVAICGKIWPRGNDENIALDAIDQYGKLGLKNIALISSNSSNERYRPIPSSAGAFATQIRQLLVLDDIAIPRAGPYDWSPFTHDKDRGRNTLISWTQLPWGGPRLLVFPAFHTPAETALKILPSQTKLLGNGDEIFLSALALEACGAETILLSRWRSGGRASLDLVGEFLKNYSELPAAEAWYRSILTVGTTELVPEKEPRLRMGSEDKPQAANHPFFWGAFLLIDRGEKPKQDSVTEETGTDSLLEQMKN